MKSGQSCLPESPSGHCCRHRNSVHPYNLLGAHSFHVSRSVPGDRTGPEVVHSHQQALAMVLSLGEALVPKERPLEGEQASK